MFNFKSLILAAVIAAAAVAACNNPAHSKGLLRGIARGAAVGVGVGAGMAVGTAAVAGVLSPKDKALAEKCEGTRFYKANQEQCDKLQK